jgi:HEAT repeat protein
MPPVRVLRPLRVLLLLLLGAGVSAITAAGTALAADPATLKTRRDAAMAAVLSDDEPLPRARAIAELAALDDADAAKALAECVTALGVRRGELETQHAATRKAYEPYAPFNLTEEKEGYWKQKRKLLEQLEREEEKLQGIAVLEEASKTAIARLRNEDAIATVFRLASAESDLRSRIVAWSGLLANPGAGAADLARKIAAEPSPAFRIEALQAIALRKDKAFAEFAAKALADPGWPVQQAAVGAIGDVKTVPALVSAMQTEDGALLEEYGKVLGLMTGQSHGHHADVWRRWYEQHKEEFAKEGADAGTVRAATKGVPKPVDFYGLQTVSRRVLFVVDISGSMKEPIGADPGAQTGLAKKDQPYEGPKIEIAKRVLSDAIQKLEPQATFNIVFFNHQVQTFQERMVPASPDMKAKAELVITDIQAAGSTWAYGALRRAFEFAGVTGTPATGKFDPLVDTIFFVSDGAPTDDSIDQAKPMAPEVILDAVREWNRLAHLKIHVTAIDPRIGKGAFVRFMKGLANQNNGSYTEIGAK